MLRAQVPTAVAQLSERDRSAFEGEQGQAAAADNSEQDRSVLKGEQGQAAVAHNSEQDRRRCVAGEQGHASTGPEAHTTQQAYKPYSPTNQDPLRGGGGKGGSKATARQREDKLLQGLSELLRQFTPNEPSAPHASQPRHPDQRPDQNPRGPPPGKGNQSSHPKQASKHHTLFQALETLVQRYRSKPTGNLLQRLQSLVHSAQAGNLANDTGITDTSSITTSPTLLHTKGKGQGTSKGKSKATGKATTTTHPATGSAGPSSGTTSTPDKPSESSWVTVV